MYFFYNCVPPWVIWFRFPHAHGHESKGVITSHPNLSSPELNSIKFSLSVGNSLYHFKLWTENTENLFVKAWLNTRIPRPAFVLTRWWLHFDRDAATNIVERSYFHGAPGCYFQALDQDIYQKGLCVSVRSVLETTSQKILLNRRILEI